MWLLTDDRIPGWKAQLHTPFMKSYAEQSSFVQEELNNRLYHVMGDFSRLQFKTDRFDHIRDFTQNIALVPTSAKTGEGLAELVMVLVGLPQHFSKNGSTADGPAKGAILEVKRAGVGHDA